MFDTLRAAVYEDEEDRARDPDEPVERGQMYPDDEEHEFVDGLCRTCGQA